VVHPDLDAVLKERLRNLLLQMDQDEDGRRALAPVGVEGFAPPDDRLYDSARAVLGAVGVAK
jgi:ABC-type phosphate/phosphonate transport system substrate-binding protein